MAAQDPSTAAAAALGSLLLYVNEHSQALEGELRRQEAWRKITDGKRFLLLLNGAEDARLVSKLLPTTTSCAVLALSSSVLPFELGLSRHNLRLLAPADAETLVGLIANGDGQRMTSSQIKRVATLCENLPLALKIAASVIRDQDARDVDLFIGDLEDESKRPELLDTGVSSVTAALNLSLKHLPPGDRRTWQALSVFRGGFEESAASRILGLSIGDTNRALSRLERHNLLMLSQREPRRRYRMHSLLRAVAWAELDAKPKRREALRLEHAGCYQAAVAEAERLARSGWPAAVKIFDSDYADIEWALNWLSDHATDSCTCAATMVDYLLSGSFSLPIVSAMKGGGPQPMLRWLNACLVAAHYLRDHCVEGDGALATADIIDQRIAVLLNNRGEHLMRLGVYDEAKADFRDAYDRSTTTGDGETQQTALDNMGAAYYRLGDLESATSCLSRAVVLARAQEDVTNEAAWLANIGINLESAGDIAGALPIFRKVLNLAKATNDRVQQAVALNQMGHCHAVRLDFDSAMVCYRRALEFAETMNVASLTATILDSMARSSIDAGNFDQAWDFALKGAGIAEPAGCRQALGENL